MKFTGEQIYRVAKRLNDRAAAATDPVRKAALARRAYRFAALVRLADERARMLTPDEIEELVRKDNESAAYFKRLFAEPPTKG